MSSSQMELHEMSGSPRIKLASKRNLILVIVVVVIIVVVGVLAGVLSADKERNDCDARVKQARLEAQKNAEKSTSKPDETTTSTTTTPVRTTTPKAPKHAWDEIRLPSDVQPTHYNMLIRTDLVNLKFTGNSNISINITSPTDLILFHINQIDIDKVEVKKNGATQKIAEQFKSDSNQFYVIQMEQMLAVGDYDLELDFSANMSTKELNGFYNSTYKDENGKTRVLGATDFQPTDARKAFPCFDEPAMRATFTISIEHDNQYHALSNMPAESTNNVSNMRKVTKFQKSVPMPTYLVAYMISDFKNLSAKTGTNNNITIRTWSTPEQFNDSAYALKIGKNVTTFLETYYDVSFPLPKQDMFAVPDFNSGAMENWGLITYRETAMLYKEGVSSETNRQRIAYVVAHELAHMWFGNLVSCKWWNDIWLNEGFASYVEYLATNHAEPDWEFLDQFLVYDLHRAFGLDALASSHAITVDVKDPEDIKTLFDAITYSKGSSIIRMLSDFLGENVFKKGLTSYLKKYRFSNAETKDLWATLTQTAPRYDVAKIMNTWTNQMGFPVVNVTRSGTNVGKAEQKHFLLDPKVKVTNVSPYGYTWHIPFTFITENNLNKTLVWMNRTSATFKWPKDEWIKANYEQYGYYRVNYDKDNWNRLTGLLKTNHEILTSSDRTSLIDDAFNLARAGQLDYKVALGVAEYIKNETRYVPWKTFINVIDFLDTMLSTQDTYGLFQKYILESIEDKVNSVKWEKSKNDTHLDIYMRSMILTTACTHGHQESNEHATRLFKNYLNGTSLDVNLKSLVYHYGIANTGYGEWDRLFNIYQNTTVASEKSKLLYGLAGSKEPWILHRLLRYSIDETRIRSQDTVTVVSYVADSAIGREFAWKFVKENWDTFYERYSKSSFRMASLIKSTTNSMNTEIDLQDVKDFFHNREKGSGARAADQAIERIQTNIDWVKRSAQSIANYLESK